MTVTARRTQTRHVGRRHSGYCRDCRDVLALERKG